jgi:hypothetical protein
MQGDHVSCRKENTRAGSTDHREGTCQVRHRVGREVSLAILKHDDLAVVVAVYQNLAFVHSAQVILGAEWIPKALRQPLRQCLSPASDWLLAGALRLERQLGLKVLLDFLLPKERAHLWASGVSRVGARNALNPALCSPLSPAALACHEQRESTGHESGKNLFSQLRHLLLEAPRLAPLDPYRHPRPPVAHTQACHRHGAVPGGCRQQHFLFQELLCKSFKNNRQKVPD